MTAITLALIYISTEQILPLLLLLLSPSADLDIYLLPRYSASVFVNILVLSISYLLGAFCSQLPFKTFSINSPTNWLYSKKTLLILPLVFLATSSTLFSLGLTSFRYGPALSEGGYSILLPLLYPFILLYSLFVIFFVSSIPSSTRFLLIPSLCLSITGLGSAFLSAPLILLLSVSDSTRLHVLSYPFLTSLFRSFRISRLLSLRILLFILILSALIPLGTFVKQSNLEILGYLDFNWYLTRISPQHVSFLNALEVYNTSSYETILNLDILKFPLDTFSFRLSRILHLIDPNPHSALLPKPLHFNVYNLSNISPLLVAGREGTTPGLFATFVYIFGPFSFIFLFIYTFFVFRLINKFFNILPYKPNLICLALVSFIILPCFLQAPLDLLSFFDETPIMAAIITLFVLSDKKRRVS